MSGERSNKIAIVTVHGTGDTSAQLDGEKWFQNGSEFSERLRNRLTEKSLESEIVPHLWAGANSATGREMASKALAKLLKRLGKSYSGVHVIGHSHGGNVANDAACMLGWSRNNRSSITSITTVGTPFFKTIVRPSERVGAWVFLGMVIVCIAMLILSAGLLFYPFGDTIAPPTEPPLDEYSYRSKIVRDEFVTGMSVLVLFGSPIIAWLLLVAVRGIVRIRRAGRKFRNEPAICTIWHPNDEAIASLQRVEALPIEVFPRWSLLAGSRTAATLWAVRALIWTPLFGLFIMVAAMIVGAADPISPWPAPLSNLGLMVVVMGLVAAPIIFALVYLTYRAFVALFLELIFRSQINASVGGSLKGLALGRDGDNRVGEVSEKSHYYGCDAMVLDGEVATRMLHASHDATRLLFSKYRTSLFSVGASDDNAVAELAQDAMTWDSLIHTTYFDQPELAEMIADRIAENVRGPGADVAKPVAQAAE